MLKGKQWEFKPQLVTQDRPPNVSRQHDVLTFDARHFGVVG